MRNKVRFKVLKTIRGKLRMKMATCDNLKLVIEIIYGDHYLKTYFAQRFKELHIKQPIAKMVEDFAKFRNGLRDEMVDKGKNKDGTWKLEHATREIDFN